MIELLETLEPYDVLAWAVLLSCLVIFWRWHLNPENQFDLSDLICENGILSSTKFMRLGSWAVMSYGFYLLAKTSPDALVGYAPLYGGIWVSARALEKWQQTNDVSLTRNETVVQTLTRQEIDQKKQSTYIESA